MAAGFDCGTYNLVCCKRDKNGDFKVKREVNAFLKLVLGENENMIFNMMQKNNVPIIRAGDTGYVCGEAAVEMAYTMPGVQLQRPMQDGCVNPKEKEAWEMLNSMIHGLLDEIEQDNEVLYYSVPANAINSETDADYHREVLKAIFDAYQSEKGYKVKAHPINEGLSLIYAELPPPYTGFGISFGSGMVNICFAIFGVPVFSFSIVNSGDWIDKMAAKAVGEDPVFINKEKTKIDLSKPPKNMVERAIQTQYRLMIERTVSGIKKGLEDNDKKVRTDKPVDIIIAGGTSSPPGFDKLFKEVVDQAKLPMSIGNIIRPDDPLFSVARGCLIAAENAST